LIWFDPRSWGGGGGVIAICPLSELQPLKLLGYRGLFMKDESGKEILYRATIKPAIYPKERHVIENAIKELGYVVHGGGTNTDMSECDISFSK